MASTTADILFDTLREWGVNVVFADHQGAPRQGRSAGRLWHHRDLKVRDRGAIVQVGSALAYRAIPLQSPYCGAKHALRGFTDSLRSELLHDKIHVTLSMVQLPAHNTPQFSWGKALLPAHPQPVPPIFQPELAAEAVFLAAQTGRREIVLGARTWIIIQGNKLFPGFGDRYLARHGFESQQTSEPLSPGRPDNLRSPMDTDRDYGAHGVFDARARRRSPQLALDRHRGAVAGAAIVLVAAVALASWLAWH